MLLGVYLFRGPLQMTAQTKVSQVSVEAHYQGRKKQDHATFMVLTPLLQPIILHSSKVPQWLSLWEFRVLLFSKVSVNFFMASQDCQVRNEGADKNVVDSFID